MHLVNVERMYGLYQQLKALVFGGETAGGKEQSPIMPAAHEPTQLDPQKRYFTGEITSLSETSGMIDEQVTVVQVVSV